MEFLEKAEADLKEEEAKTLLRVYKGYKYLELEDKEKLLDCVETTRKTIGDMINLDTSIYSEFYRLQALFFYKKGDLEDYYRNGIQFLSYTKEAEMTKEEQQMWSRNLAIAVMVGKNIYNIGELLQKKILRSLVGSPHEWLLEVIETFNGGQIAKFQAKMKEHAGRVASEPLIQSNTDLIN